MNKRITITIDINVQMLYDLIFFSINYEKFNTLYRDRIVCGDKVWNTISYIINYKILFFLLFSFCEFLFRVLFSLAKTWYSKDCLKHPVKANFYFYSCISDRYYIDIIFMHLYFHHKFWIISSKEYYDFWMSILNIHLFCWTLDWTYLFRYYFMILAFYAVF